MPAAGSCRPSRRDRRPADGDAYRAEGLRISTTIVQARPPLDAMTAPARRRAVRRAAEKTPGGPALDARGRVGAEDIESGASLAVLTDICVYTKYSLPFSNAEATRFRRGSTRRPIWLPLAICDYVGTTLRRGLKDGDVLPADGDESRLGRPSRVRSHVHDDLPVPFSGSTGQFQPGCTARIGCP
jgi:hypothetical protein